MKFFDRAFGTTLAAFFLGAFVGALVTASSLAFRELLATLLVARVLTPVRVVTGLGGFAVVLLIFANNCVPPLLSFLYAWLIAKVRWAPPLTDRTRRRLLAAFSLLTGGLIGFFNLGASLVFVWETGGVFVLRRLLTMSWIHAPLEFLFVLVCVGEPARLAGRRIEAEGFVGSLRGDLALLIICVIGLLASAAIEVFANL